MVLDAVLGPILSLLLKGFAWVCWLGGLLAGGGGSAVGLAVGQSVVEAGENVDYDTVAAVEGDLGVFDNL
eukprot:1641788-Rhodomonas_salina.7